MQRRTAYIIAIAFVGLVVVANVMYLLFGNPDIGFRRSSLGTSPRGHKAFYAFLQQADLSPARNHALPTRMEGKKGALFLIEPQALLVKRDVRYLTDLKTWVSNGNTLLLALPPTVSSNGSCPPSAPFRDLFKKLGFALQSSCEEMPRDNPELSEKPNDPEARTLTQNCGKLGLQAVCGFSGSSVEQADHVVFLNDKPFLLEFRQGKGRIVLVADGSFFRNGRILEDDNALFAYNIAYRYGTDGIVFDEYYHGLYRSPNVVRLLFTYPYNIVATAFFLCVVLFVWSRIRYFGPPVSEEEPDRRSRAEHLHAMADMFQGCGKTNMMLRHLVAGLTEELRKSYRMREVKNPADIVERLRACACDEADAIGRALVRIEAALGSDRQLSETEMFTLYTNLWKPVRKEIHAANQRTL